MKETDQLGSSLALGGETSSASVVDVRSGSADRKGLRRMAAVVVLAGLLLAFAWPREGGGGVGPTGPAGPAGEDGAPGVAGPQGSPGAAGRPGISGGDGIDGQDGSDGSNGAAGAPGAPGPQGSPGAAGPPGSPGPAGSPGASGAPGGIGNGQGSILVLACDPNVSISIESYWLNGEFYVDHAEMSVDPVACGGTEVRLLLIDSEDQAIAGGTATETISVSPVVFNFREAEIPSIDVARIAFEVTAPITP